MIGDGVRAAARRAEPIGWTTFELESPGGYGRAVTGLVANLDGEAETYVVLERDGALRRIPVRQIMTSRDAFDGDRRHRITTRPPGYPGDVAIR